MSLLKNLVLKYDKSIVTALFYIMIVLIPSMILVPALIESYTYNAYTTGLRVDYVEYSDVFRFLHLFSIAFIVIFIVYNLLRRYFLGKTKTGPYAYKFNLLILLLIFLVPTISLYFMNSNYESKNNAFIITKLIDVKNSLVAGKCSLEKTKDSSVSYGRVSDCGTVKEKMPGDLWFLSAGKFTKSVKKDDVNTVVTMDKPNTITYNEYLPSFCRTLADKDNSLYKEFNVIEVHGINALSPDFKVSSCEEHKNQGQIQFMFK